MPLTIFAVGDIMLGEQPLCENFGVKTVVQTKGTEYLFREVSSLLKTGDIVFGNLECSLALHDMDLKKGSFFCSYGHVVHGLKGAGFTALLVANNHIMENGKRRFSETVHALQDEGITPVGVLGEIPVIEIMGYRVAFLGYSFIDDGIPDVCYTRVTSEEPIIDDIRAVRSDADIVIIALHWGYEYVPFPSPDQVRIGRALVDAGADIILGGHPHVTQGYEIYRNRPILYSLGNFVFDQTFIPSTLDSFITKISVSDHPFLIDVEIFPVRIDDRAYFPKPLSSPESEKMLMTVAELRSQLEKTNTNDYELQYKNYISIYQERKRPVIRRMGTHFISNLHRYSLKTISLIVCSFVKRRNRCSR